MSLSFASNHWTDLGFDRRDSVRLARWGDALRPFEELAAESASRHVGRRRITEHGMEIITMISHSRSEGLSTSRSYARSPGRSESRTFFARGENR